MTEQPKSIPIAQGAASASDRFWIALAWLIWVVPLVVFAGMVITRPGSRTVVDLY
jgi:hypothetical protein